MSLKSQTDFVPSVLILLSAMFILFNMVSAQSIQSSKVNERDSACSISTKRDFEVSQKLAVLLIIDSDKKLRSSNNKNSMKELPNTDGESKCPVFRRKNQVELEISQNLAIPLIIDSKRTSREPSSTYGGSKCPVSTKKNHAGFEVAHKLAAPMIIDSNKTSREPSCTHEESKFSAPLRNDQADFEVSQKLAIPLIIESVNKTQSSYSKKSSSPDIKRSVNSDKVTSLKKDHRTGTSQSGKKNFGLPIDLISTQKHQSDFKVAKKSAILLNRDQEKKPSTNPIQTQKYTNGISTKPLIKHKSTSPKRAINHKSESNTHTQRPSFTEQTGTHAHLYYVQTMPSHTGSSNDDPYDIPKPVDIRHIIDINKRQVSIVDKLMLGTPDEGSKAQVKNQIDVVQVEAAKVKPIADDAVKVRLQVKDAVAKARVLRKKVYAAKKFTGDEEAELKALVKTAQEGRMKFEKLVKKANKSQKMVQKAIIRAIKEAGKVVPIAPLVESKLKYYLNFQVIEIAKKIVFSGSVEDTPDVIHTKLLKRNKENLYRLRKLSQIIVVKAKQDQVEKVLKMLKQEANKQKPRIQKLDSLHEILENHKSRNANSELAKISTLTDQINVSQNKMRQHIVKLARSLKARLKLVPFIQLNTEIRGGIHPFTKTPPGSALPSTPSKLSEISNLNKAAVSRVTELIGAEQSPTSKLIATKYLDAVVHAQQTVDGLVSESIAVKAKIDAKMSEIDELETKMVHTTSKVEKIEIQKKILKADKELRDERKQYHILIVKINHQQLIIQENIEMISKVIYITIVLPPLVMEEKAPVKKPAKPILYKTKKMSKKTEEEENEKGINKIDWVSYEAKEMICGLKKKLERLTTRKTKSLPLNDVNEKIRRLKVQIKHQKKKNAKLKETHRIYVERSKKEREAMAKKNMKQEQSTENEQIIGPLKASERSNESSHPLYTKRNHRIVIVYNPPNPSVKSDSNEPQSKSKLKLNSTGTESTNHSKEPKSSKKVQPHPLSKTPPAQHRKTSKPHLKQPTSKSYISDPRRRTIKSAIIASSRPSTTHGRPRYMMANPNYQATKRYFESIHRGDAVKSAVLLI